MGKLVFCYWPQCCKFAFPICEPLHIKEIFTHAVK